MNHEIYMQRCLQLAALGNGAVAPNPMVGAVVVQDEYIIGEGYHQVYGQAHAEVNAIQEVVNKYPDAAERLQKSRIYVSLEPCAHQGKTPPCADLIVKHRIPEVIIGCTDTFAAVNGKGIAKLQTAGIQVSSGILEKECRDLNKRFFTFQEQKRPYIILKWAQTADGFLAPEPAARFPITGELANRLVHRWRTEEAAILVGTRTALIDNPQLTARLHPGNNPIRIFIDRDLQVPDSHHLLDGTSPTIIFNQKHTRLEPNRKYFQQDFNEYLPQFILYQLYLQDVQSLIIEGGKFTLEQFIKVGLWDEARIFTGTDTLKKGLKAPDLEGKKISSEQIGEDRLDIYTQHG